MGAAIRSGPASFRPPRTCFAWSLPLTFARRSHGWSRSLTWHKLKDLQVSPRPSLGSAPPGQRPKLAGAGTPSPASPPGSRSSLSLEMRRRYSSPFCGCGEEAVSVLLEQRVHPPPGSRPSPAPPEPPMKSRMWEAGLGQHTPSKQGLGGPKLQGKRRASARQLSEHRFFPACFLFSEDFPYIIH